jgi:hypothetical protein
MVDKENEQREAQQRRDVPLKVPEEKSGEYGLDHILAPNQDGTQKSGEYNLPEDQLTHKKDNVGK